MQSNDQSSTTKQGKQRRALSICATVFSESLEATEAREMALALQARMVDVHLKPRWLEETGVDREEHGKGQSDKH